MVNISLLQTNTQTKKYLEACHYLEKNKKILGHDPEAEKIFWDLIPRHIVSRCPICGKEVAEQVDTYSLRYWVRATDGEHVFDRRGIRHCKHFVVTHGFIGFNNTMPAVNSTELVWNDDYISEAPFVYPFMFEKEKKCKAVLHSLPICRIEGDKFVPRYTLYIMTYFAPRFSVSGLKKVLRKYDPGIYRRCLLPYPHEGIADVDSWWDLKKYVEEGKLYWLEQDNPEGILKSEPSEFPYANIEGRRLPYFKRLPEKETKRLKK